jgi:cystathionine beta-lyase family protein involved in aluminum resistance
MNAAERIARAEEELALVFEEIDTREIRLTRKVLDAFREHGVASRHFAPTNG